MSLAEDATRCFWAGLDPVNRDYHDAEWGRPVADDHRLFEKLCLEGFQSGLSWLTILRKRENFRNGFAGFDPAKVARFGKRDVARLLADAGIVRHRGKIEAANNNASRALEAIDEFGSLAALVWRFEPPPSERPKRLTRATLMQMSETPASQRLSRELRRRGWRFVGPTTCYACMQAMGLVNDHTEDCAVRAVVEAERRKFNLPQKKREVGPKDRVGVETRRQPPPQPSPLLGEGVRYLAPGQFPGSCPGLSPSGGRPMSRRIRSDVGGEPLARSLKYRRMARKIGANGRASSPAIRRHSGR